MNDRWLRRFAWFLTVYGVTVLVVSAIWLFSGADYSRLNWLEAQVSTIAYIGAPILGLIIIRRQARQRVGWLLLTLGVLVSFRALGHAIYYGNSSQATGYSPLEYFLLWSTEATNLFVLVCQALLLLWFPDGQLGSPRWRILYLFLFVGFAVLFLNLFGTGPNWNGGKTAGGIIIDNPYGWIPAEKLSELKPWAFLALVLSQVLAAVSLIFRYRSARQLVRHQIRWFILGGTLFVIMNFAPLLINDVEVSTFRARLLHVIAFSNSLPLFIAMGIAILRYRLYDIDIIIRRTLQYALLTGLLALLYYGSVLLLQGLVENVTGEQSPFVIVFSTLAIAALFNPLRHAVQNFIDRRFYRAKYDAEQTLAQFATIARDEVDMDKLAVALLHAVDETIQPENATIWLKATRTEISETEN